MKKQIITTAALLLALAATMQASSILMQDWETAAGGAPSGTTSQVFSYTENNVTFDLTVTATGGNIFYDASVIGVGNDRINTFQTITLSLVATAHAGFSLDTLDFKLIRLNSIDDGSSYSFTDNLSGTKSVLISDANLKTFGNATANNLISDVVTLTPDNAESWALKVTTDTGSFALSNFQVNFTTILTPEPEAYTLLAGLTGLAVVIVRRRKSTRLHSPKS